MNVFIRRNKFSLLLCCIFMCASCGGGGSSSSGSNNGPTPVTPLSLGSTVIDNSERNNGTVTFSFPDALGDQPRITAVTATGSNGNGIADLSHASSTSFTIASDSFNVHFPTTGDYIVTITISDSGDTPQQKIVNVSIPETNKYALSGLVQDGPLNNTVGVQSNVRLYWNPLGYAAIQIALTQSNAGSSGAYAFSNLVGPASYFRVAVDSGTQ